MDDDDRRLDGNSAAGILGEIFPFDITMARTVCGGCRQIEPVGAQPVYADAPGTVMRCIHCSSVLMKVVQGGGRYWLDMTGVACLQIDEWRG